MYMKSELKFYLFIFSFLLSLNLEAQEIENKLHEIQLSGYVTNKNSEISGMSWYNDNLILVPQYPEKKGAIYSLQKKDILAYINKVEKNKNPRPLSPKAISITTQYWEILDGYEGYEAIVIDSKTGESWLTIEFEPEESFPYSIIVKGQLNKDMTSLTIDPIDYSSYLIQKISSQSKVTNMAEEALVLVPAEEMNKRQIISIHEANGVEGQKLISAFIFSNDLKNNKAVEMPRIPYRITDATEINSDGRFWVINCFYQGDRCLSVLKDGLIQFYNINQGKSHQRNLFVERLVELQYKNGKISLSNTKPIQLELKDDESRNWEGIVRLEEKGFLLITDKFPKTMLAFVRR